MKLNLFLILIVFPTLLWAEDKEIPKPTKTGVVVIIANNHSNMAFRNLQESIGLKHFNTHMRPLYDEVHICMGEEGTWECFREGLNKVGPKVDILDLIMETNGNYTKKGAYAVDNNSDDVYAHDILDSDFKKKYRMGFFTSCFSSKTDNGFPQVFLKFGGKGTYGSENITWAGADLMIMFKMATEGKTLGEACQEYQESGVDEVGKNLMRIFYPDHDPEKLTCKVAFGDLDLRITEPNPINLPKK